MVGGGYLNILHDEILLAGEVKDFFQLDDVGMVYCCQDGDFTLNHVLFPLTFCLHQTEWVMQGKKLRWETEEIFWVNSSFQLSKKPATHLKQLIRQKWAINSSAETTLQMSKSIKSGHCTIIWQTMTMTSFHLVNNLDGKLLPGDATVADTHNCKIAVSNHLGSWSQSDETFATSNREKSNKMEFRVRYKFWSPGADGTFQ